MEDFFFQFFEQSKKRILVKWPVIINLEIMYSWPWARNCWSNPEIDCFRYYISNSRKIYWKKIAYENFAYLWIEMDETFIFWINMKKKYAKKYIVLNVELRAIHKNTSFSTYFSKCYHLLSGFKNVLYNSFLYFQMNLDQTFPENNQTFFEIWLIWKTISFLWKHCSF